MNLPGKFALVLLTVLLISWVVWPLFLELYYRLFGCRRKSGASSYYPSVSIVFSAHNEETVIESKIRNCLSIDYPEELLEIVVVSDGSCDETNAILSSINHPRIKIIISENQQGKSLSLNMAKQVASGEIVVFTDANAILDVQCIKHLVAKFTPNVGCVSGALRYQLDEIESLEGGCFYWKYETAIKKAESAVGCLIGGVGPLFAIRKDLWRDLQSWEVPDLALGLTALENGFKAIYEPSAFCLEKVSESQGHENSRYRRIIRRSIPTALAISGRLILRKRFFSFLCLFWHKLIRYFTFPIMLLMVVFAALSANTTTGAVLSFVFLVGLLCALMGMIRPLGSRVRIFRMAAYILSVQISGGLGVWDWAIGRKSGIWTVPDRTQISAHGRPVRP